MNGQQLNLEQIVRAEVKSLFDAKPDFDPLYNVYHAIDKAITQKFDHLTDEADMTQKEILRIVEFFNTFNFFESLHDFVRDMYISSNHFRHGFLTNGVLFRAELVEGKLAMEIGYTMTDLATLYAEKPALYRSILNEVQGELAEVIATDAGEKWYFWPGCEMKIPMNTKILLDSEITKSKFIISEEKERQQIVLKEKPYTVEISLLQNNELVYTSIDNEKIPDSDLVYAQQAEATNADFGKVTLELKNDKKYNYTLYVPYNSPRSDIKTQVKIFNDNKVEEFVATTS